MLNNIWTCYLTAANEPVKHAVHLNKMHGVGCNTLQPTQIKMLQSTSKQRVERLMDFLFDSVVLKESD